MLNSVNINHMKLSIKSFILFHLHISKMYNTSLHKSISNTISYRVYTTISNQIISIQYGNRSVDHFACLKHTHQNNFHLSEDSVNPTF